MQLIHCDVAASGFSHSGPTVLQLCSYFDHVPWPDICLITLAATLSQFIPEYLTGTADYSTRHHCRFNLIGQLIGALAASGFAVSSFGTGPNYGEVIDVPLRNSFEHVDSAHYLHTYISLTRSWCGLIAQRLPK